MLLDDSLVSGFLLFFFFPGGMVYERSPSLPQSIRFRDFLPSLISVLHIAIFNSLQLFWGVREFPTFDYCSFSSRGAFFVSAESCVVDGRTSLPAREFFCPFWTFFFPVSTMRPPPSFDRPDHPSTCCPCDRVFLSSSGSPCDHCPLGRLKTLF